MRRHRPAAVPALDGGLAALAVALTAVAVLAQPNPVGTPVAGPGWLRLLFPLLLGVPLLWRRSAPLVALAVPMGALVLQAVLTGDSPEGLELMLAVGAAGYSVGAYCSRRVAVAGLGIGLAGYAVYALENRDIRSGSAGELWAGSFFLLALVALWLLGVVVRGRREERQRRERAAAARAEAEQAAREERSRLARELHDVISSTLSVVVTQAAGARAAGEVGPATLERIENSGRESLVEMRRLLSVLRRDQDEVERLPQPGAGDLPALVAQLVDAGLPVELTVDGDPSGLPPALGLQVYRIVQESLTNVLKHAGPATARVRIGYGPDAVCIDVEDDGGGPPDRAGGGHGLAGMRERVALFGGELRTGARPGGGFAVHARLPRKPVPA